MDQVKITSLELENVKRIKAVRLTPAENGLTVIGGNNGQGKTSVLDAITWALGGDRYRPSAPARKGSVLPPHIRLELSNGLVVERAGKNSALKVTDPSGQRAGQQLLNSFVEELALNLPKFMESSSKEKADTLLRIIGVGDQLAALEFREKQLYNQRFAIGRIADQKARFAKEMPFYDGVPEKPVSALELIRRQQEILARNGENQRKRDRLGEITRAKERALDEAQRLEAQIRQLTQQKEAALQKYAQAQADEATALKTVAELQDESTAAIEQDLSSIEAVNIKVRANLDREKAEEEAAAYASQYSSLTQELEQTRQQKYDLLSGAQLPLEGLSVEDGELTYHGRKWDAMSSSDQLRVSTAIVRALNPQCGFILLDKLEQMDLHTLTEFGAWLREQGLQAIATRVSTGGECSIIIEDGCAEADPLPAPGYKSWKDGVF